MNQDNTHAKNPCFLPARSQSILRLSLGLLLALGAARAAQAQGMMGTAQISSCAGCRRPLITPSPCTTPAAPTSGLFGSPGCRRVGFSAAMPNRDHQRQSAGTVIANRRLFRAIPSSITRTVAGLAPGDSSTFGFHQHGYPSHDQRRFCRLSGDPIGTSYIYSDTSFLLGQSVGGPTRARTLHPGPVRSWCAWACCSPAGRGNFLRGRRSRQRPFNL